MVIVFIFLFIVNCEAIRMDNASLWETRQYVNSMPFISEVLSLPVAPPGELPFLVIILDERVELCNGVIITHELVLTSYICMKPEIYLSGEVPVTNINVLIGIRDTSVIEEIRPTWRQAKELSCNSNASNADVALIKLTEGLSLGGLVNHISVPVKPFNGTFKHCFMAGFVFTDYPGPVYQYSEITEVSNQDTCKETLKLNDSMKVAHSVCSTSMNPSRWKCRVDDSRMVFCDKTVIGFIKESTTRKCQNETTTFIFSDIGSHYEFFKKYIGQLTNIVVIERTAGNKPDGYDLSNLESDFKLQIEETKHPNV
ncbi:hypothetical protein ILUMI_23570 [Ignelater luminosus]|uniref:Peptidase S1 domain-containing protein n=1 Tax=Ignelater luminosus TaxID=2038154 RepID=A0A8K0CC83_IGNLU|nr:hypothetical protein ILUMI_23570 [Ignelater luminosus]